MTEKNLNVNKFQPCAHHTEIPPVNTEVYSCNLFANCVCIKILIKFWFSYFVSFFNLIFLMTVFPFYSICLNQLDNELLKEGFSFISRRASPFFLPWILRPSSLRLPAITNHRKRCLLWRTKAFPMAALCQTPHQLCPPPRSPCTLCSEVLLIFKVMFCSCFCSCF